jgi:hypothetical protein
MSFWKTALKFHAPASISGFVFFYLASALLGKDSLLHENPVLSVVILVVVANFCAYLLYRSTVLPVAPVLGRLDIQDNLVADNEVGGGLDMSVGATGLGQEVHITGNEVSRNKVKGDLYIGTRKNNG